MPTKTLAVEGIDNRGDAEVPFGFVYFTDDLRVTFSKDRGIGTGEQLGRRDRTSPQARSGGSCRRWHCPVLAPPDRFGGGLRARSGLAGVARKHPS